MTINRRPLYAGGPDVGEIGFGAWGLGGGWGARDDQQGLAALHAAIDAGIDLIDTAASYGQGHSERLVGSVVRERSETVYVTTKVPPKNGQWPAAPGTPVDDAFPKGHIRTHTEKSLTDLGLDHVQVQQLHVWDPGWLTTGDWQQEVADLKSEGLIKAFGISINDHQPDTGIEAVRSGVIDTVQVIYNVFDQSPEDGLLDACAEHGVGVIVRVALDEGGLTGAITAGTTFEDDDWRAEYFRGDRPAQVAEHVDRIVEDLGITVDDLPATALRYVLSSPAVSTVIVGMRRPERIAQNVAVADGKGLPADQVEKLHAHRWDRNFYD